ncbi:MAG: Gfo/Idh/MocA family oxidoreductase [Pirellulales bacterium]|nr:Gfo/Idh/MocA family oxidoreductase [Pirellulales bacterium]
MHEGSMPGTSPVKNANRREFLKTSSAAAVGVGLAAQFSLARQAHAAENDDTIRIALVGCGGRGTGAIQDSLQANQRVKLIAMADAFGDRLNSSLDQLMRNGKIAPMIDVPEDRRFVGLDAYQKALATDCDLVILATPPGFRPIHFEAAVSANKHVFMEKPVATDAPGVRRVLAAVEESKKKNLGVGVGLQRRHHGGYIETIKRLQDGAIGDIIAARVYWNGGPPWVHRRSELKQQYGRDLSEMEYQLRNWYYFVWLCGDNIVEQHIHNLDVINWLKGAYPVKANGMGGSQVRRGPDYGQIYDHHCVEFEYADGTRMFSQCRQTEGCWSSISEHAHGSKGYADISGHEIFADGSKPSWQFPRGRRQRDYEQEHADLIASIRAGSPLNEGEYGAKSTMTAILGRMCTYSGQVLSWDDALASTVSYLPTELDFQAQPPVTPGADGMYAVPMPGITKVI